MPSPRLVGDKPASEFREAAEAGFHTRPVLVGPITFLMLAKAADDYDEAEQALRNMVEAARRVRADLPGA